MSALAVSEAEREAVYENRWAMGGLNFTTAFNDLLVDKAANDTLAAFIRWKIREIVDDPDVAETPSPDSIVGCKRLRVDTGDYQSFNRPNVSLVDLNKTSIEAITPDGVGVTDKVHQVDVIVLATGFDAMTGALDKINIRGRSGRTLKDKWSAGPRTYLGLTVAGFPNLFTITGPGSPSALTNMLP